MLPDGGADGSDPGKKFGTSFSLLHQRLSDPDPEDSKEHLASTLQQHAPDFLKTLDTFTPATAETTAAFQAEFDTAFSKTKESVKPKLKAKIEAASQALLLNEAQCIRLFKRCALFAYPL